MMPAFPSLEWFEAVKDLVNQDEAFRRLGTVDARVGVKVGETIYELTFEAFECAGVREIGPEDLRDCDFWLEQEPEAWDEMISNIQQNGKADLSHTLNTIDLTRPDGFARSYDGYRRDAFYRFNQSLQHFFDISSRLETAFAL
jgi:hypothetical protein